jgi:hypothetical protein
VPGTAVPTLPVADADIPIKRRDDYARREVESGRCLMQIEFVASVAVITPTPKESRRLYIDALGLPLYQLDGEYFASEEIGGCKHFGVWPLEQAAQACFGASTWPDDIAVPQASL